MSKTNAYNTIVVVGESGSGKSSVVCQLEGMGYNRIIPYTTRPIRENEKDGVDYHFIKEEEALQMLTRQEFAEYEVFNGWIYGTKKSDYTDKLSVVTCSPSSMRQLKAAGYGVWSVYIDVDRRLRLISMLQRGDNIEEAYRRNLQDVGQFSGVSMEVDMTYYNGTHKYLLSPSALAHKIKRDHGFWKEAKALYE